MPQIEQWMREAAAKCINWLYSHVTKTDIAERELAEIIASEYEKAKESQMGEVNNLPPEGIIPCDDPRSSTFAAHAPATPDTITINEAARFIRKIEACEGMAAKLILMRQFAERVLAKAAPTTPVDALVNFIRCIGDIEDEEFTQAELDELRRLANEARQGREK